jgi:hypothetical protein
METLNLKKLWEAMNTLIQKQQDLEEQDIFVNLLGHSSEYIDISFDGFLREYSFRFNNEDKTLIVYNDDGVPYESWSNNDFSYVPICLLSFSAEQIEEWMENEIKKQLDQQEENKIKSKENLRLQIERLTKEYNEL